MLKNGGTVCTQKIGKILCTKCTVLRQKSTTFKIHELAINITHIGCTNLFYQMINIIELKVFACL